MDYKPETLVVYVKHKHTNNPKSDHAKNLHPELHGEYYHYDVDKYWKVINTTETEVICETRKGKIHRIPKDDVRLRKATWFEKIFQKNKWEKADD